MRENKREELEDMARRLEAAGWGVNPPEQYLSDLDEEFLRLWDQVRCYTLISVERAWAFAEALRYVCRNRIPGDIVECGVWRGGACLLASLILIQEEPKTRRRIWLYDTFSGMVSPGEEDRIAASGQPLKEREPEGWWSAGLNEVKSNLRSSPLSQDQFQFVPGRVEETLLSTVPQEIAVLRLDTDWYASTKIQMEVLYPKLVPGGVLAIDDYGHFTGSRQAVDEYFANQGESVLLHRSDYTGRIAVKPWNTDL